MTCLTGSSADMSSVFLLMFFIMVILIPILTMRTMADDKRQKTDQLTLTSPVSLFGLVAGKFLAAFLIFLIGAAIMLISAGILISSLTENQMIAAIGSIGVNILLCLFDIISNFVTVPFLKNIINALSVLYKYQEFTYGIFSLKNILFFLSLIAVFNFLTMRVIERRRWS